MKIRIEVGKLMSELELAELEPAGLESAELEPAKLEPAELKPAELKPDIELTSSRLRLVLISGVSGSGKSIALRALEDAGYYCIDNLPLALLEQTVHLLRDAGTTQVAVSIDARGGTSLQALPGFLDKLSADGADLRVIFLDARDHTLVRRFAETRRRHPLARGDRTIEECLREERLLLSPVADYDRRLDTSELTPIKLRDWIKKLIGLDTCVRTLVLESFSYRSGAPLDADLVFDARCLPNPFYEPQLRALTGQDLPVVRFLDQQPRATELMQEIAAFLDRWLPEYALDNRHFFTVAIGCTGGQHRSVYLAEKLAQEIRSTMKSKLAEGNPAQRFSPDLNVLVRHREISET